MLDKMSVKMCNCAKCDKELTGVNNDFSQASLADLADLPPMVAGRRNQRPYCSQCLHNEQWKERLADALVETAVNGRGET